MRSCVLTILRPLVLPWANRENVIHLDQSLSRGLLPQKLKNIGSFRRRVELNRKPCRRLQLLENVISDLLRRVYAKVGLVLGSNKLKECDLARPLSQH